MSLLFGLNFLVASQEVDNRTFILQKLGRCVKFSSKLTSGGLAESCREQMLALPLCGAHNQGLGIWSMFHVFLFSLVCVMHCGACGKDKKAWVS